MDLALIAAYPDDLERYADPGEFVVQACTRAKEWLTQAIEHGDIDQIVNMKSQAEAIRVYSAQKQIGKDAELAAAEIVRRAERGLGLCIRRGQEEGTVLSKGQWNTRGDVVAAHGSKLSPKGVFGGNTNAAVVAHAMAEVRDEAFDEALAEARAEENMSRANVARKVEQRKAPESLPARIAIARQMAAEGHTTEQIADTLSLTRDAARRFCQRHNISVHADSTVKGTRRTDSNKIVDGTVMSLVGIDSGLERIDYEALNSDLFDGWLSVLKAAKRSLTTLINGLEKEMHNRGSE